MCELNAIDGVGLCGGCILIILYSLKIIFVHGFQAIILAALRGLGDSLKGTITLFYLDKNIKERALRTSPVKDHNTPSRRKESNRESHKSSKKEEYVHFCIFCLCTFIK